MCGERFHGIPEHNTHCSVAFWRGLENLHRERFVMQLSCEAIPCTPVSDGKDQMEFHVWMRIGAVSKTSLPHTWIPMCNRLPHWMAFFLSEVSISRWCWMRVRTQWKFDKLSDSLQSTKLTFEQEKKKIQTTVRSQPQQQQKNMKINKIKMSQWYSWIIAIDKLQLVNLNIVDGQRFGHWNVFFVVVAVMVMVVAAVLGSVVYSVRKLAIVAIFHTHLTNGNWKPLKRLNSIKNRIAHNK